MIQYLLKKIIGTKNARELKKLTPRVAQINKLEDKMRALSDAELRGLTGQFRQKIDQGASLDELLHEAFAAVREAGRRTVNMRHFDVQLLGGMILHRGSIAEMKTGEGKTLVATLPLYLNALSGHGAHLITVNDYLAKRDSEWMGRIYKFLGMSVGVIYHDMPEGERQRAYRSDITYGQNNEFGFDYLRDNMKESIERYVQRELNYAIVDEVDSILIDEARTPLIISGPAEESADLYYRVNQIVPSLKRDVDYTVDEKAHSAMLTDAGVDRVEKRLGCGNLYDPANIEWLHHVQQALRAHTLYKRDVNYLVENDQVVIIDEFTGRKMPGRRWSDGLHQAIEAKENVKIEEENQTLATITFQNYFRMYKKLSGMTGTAETEAEEFWKIYKLDVLSVPTHHPCVRQDFDDVIYKTEKAKFKFITEEIMRCQEQKQPVLVGTVSVEKSEVISKFLTKAGVKHNILNAKHHQREAEFVAQAGRLGAVTISTNMAGRGTDILLGGNPEMMAKAEVDPVAEPEKFQEVLARYKQQCAEEHKEVVKLGGLHIVGTERHEARRIDNQLRGRAGRQGDPGSSRFFLSLEDDLLRIFGAERIQGLMDRMGMAEDERIEHRLVNRAIENAQKRVEGHNFDIRKNLLEYDDVMSQQRKTIYALRKQVLEGRYFPELTEEEIKQGKIAEPPTKSGELTIEKVVELVRPRVQQVVEAFFTALAEAEKMAAATPGVPPTEKPKINHELMKREFYRFFGAVIDFQAAIPQGQQTCIELAQREVASSLIQQRERILDMCDLAIGNFVGQFCNEKLHPDEWNLDGLEEALLQTFGAKINARPQTVEPAVIAEHIWNQVEKLIGARENDLGPLYFLFFARHFALEEIDNQWIDNLKAMDHLREGIGLRGYGQRDPKQEYKKEGYNIFAEMMERLNSNILTKLFHVVIERPEEQAPEYKHKQRRTVEGRGSEGGGGGEAAKEESKPKTVVRTAPRIGRNDPCPCGSGKKYKRCHMERDQQQSQ